MFAFDHNDILLDVPAKPRWVPYYCHRNFCCGALRPRSTQIYHARQDEIDRQIIQSSASLDVADAGDASVDVPMEIDLDVDAPSQSDELISDELEDMNAGDISVDADNFDQIVESFTLSLLDLQSRQQLTQSTVTNILKILQNTLGPCLPSNLVQKLPSSYQQALRSISTSLAGSKTYGVCRNECCVFVDDLEQKDVCPKCGIAKFDESGKPFLTFRYIPLIP